MSLKDFNQSGAIATDTVVLSVADGKLVVPDAPLLFGAEFLRVGRDLILRNEGHADLRILEYFRANPPADIFAPDGAVLRGASVARLAGPEAPGQYAQLGGARGGEPIGQVETTEGGTRVQGTDGTVETLAVGMKIFQGDVVETDADGALSLTFADGTIFTLAAASRMVIDDLVYDPDGTDNSAGFSLVQGGFVFIAGRVAQTGGMDVTTPSATMGIRGTTVIVRIQLDDGIAVTEVTLAPDPDGGLGQVELRDLDGNLIATITTTDSKWIVSSAEGETREIQRTAEDDASDSLLIADAITAFQLAATRVAQGETFVTLPSAPVPVDDDPVESDEEDDPSDVDTEDEPLPPAPEDAGEGGGDGGGGGVETVPAETPPFRPPVEAVDLVVTGPEDAGTGEEGEPVAGRIETGETGTTFALEAPPGNGTVTLNPDGTFTYVPDPDFNGTDSFTYRVTDARGSTDTGRVEVVITPVNDDPVPADNGGAADEDTILFGTVAATDVDGDPLGYALETGASNGLAAVLPDGTWSYAPDENFNGTDAFTVRVTDGQGGSAIATVAIEIAAVNDTPEITSAPLDIVFPEAALTPEAVGFTPFAAMPPATGGTFTAADVDGDAVAFVYGPVTVEVRDPEGASVPDFPASPFGLREGGIDLALGLLALNPDGMWSLGPSDAFNRVPEGYALIYTGTVSARDDSGTGNDTSAPQVFTITVTGENDAPVIASAETTGVLSEAPQDYGEGEGEGGEGTGIYSASGEIAVSDPDDGSTHTATITPGAPGYVGTFTTDAGGFTDTRPEGGSAGILGWTFSVDPDEVDFLSEGADLVQTYTLSVTDDAGASVDQVVTITITGANDSAFIVGTTAGTVSEDTTAPVTGQVAVADPDTGEAGVVPQTGISGSFGTFGIDAAGNWSYALDNTLEAVQALAPGDTLEDRFPIVSADGTAFDDVVITITGVNDAPTIISGPSDHSGQVTEGAEDTTTSGLLIAEDVEGGEVTFTLTSPATGTYGSLVLLASGAWSYTLDQALADPLGDLETAVDVFTVAVSDPEGATTPQDITITILGTNDAPIVPFQTLVEVQQDSVFSDTFAAFDVEGDDLTFVAGSTAPQNGFLIVSPDGSFDYIPFEGFLGTDTFTYEVSDGNGGTTTGTVNVEVENAGTTGDTRPIAIGISTEATPEVPAGSLVIEVAPVDGNAINISFALDSSGSIGSAQWTVMTDAVATALETLATQFSGSETQVDVQIISYSGSVQVFTYDLQDATIGTEARALPFIGGGTNWTAAFNSAETFFDAQPAGEANYLFFITDGDPTVSGWEAALASLTDVTTNVYTVDIDAFAIGPNVNGENLTLVDSDPVPSVGTNYDTLTSAADLLAALNETPLFNPELIGLSVQLIADGVDLGVIADETSPALVVNGLDYQLPFAAIDGIGDLLGEQNRFNVTVQYDLNGDSEDAEVTLFTTELLAKAATAQALTGDAGPDLLLGSDLVDTIDGVGGDDVIFGFAGDDVITGGPGFDDIRAGEGNDRIIMNETELLGERVDGGAGQDVLAFGTGGFLTDLLEDLLLEGIEALDFENAQTDTVILTGTKVIEASDTANTLLESLLGQPLDNSMMIFGDVGDELQLFDDVGTWEAAGGSISSGGRAFDIYALVGFGSSDVVATIGVDTDISVLLSSAPGV